MTVLDNVLRCLYNSMIACSLQRHWYILRWKPRCLDSCFRNIIKIMEYLNWNLHNLLFLY